MIKNELNEIPSQIIKLLCDKSIEKRNLGMRELESFFKQSVDWTNEESISNFIKVYRSQLYDQVGAPNYNVSLRKAAFSGFLVFSNYLKSQSIYFTNPFYLLIQPLITSFRDNDPKTIVDSANTLIRIIRNQGKIVLKFFNEIFEGLLILHVNTDQEVRNSAYSLDEQIKETMRNSLQTLEMISLSDFNFQDLVDKLIEKIRAPHPSIKILIGTWITFLDSIPELKLINYLPYFLPGVFNMLCDKIKDVNQSAEKILKDFLPEIEKQLDALPNNSSEVLNKILEIIIEQCKTINEQGKVTAFDWLSVFLKKYAIILNNLYNKSFKIQSSYYSKIRYSNLEALPNLNTTSKFNLSEEISNINKQEKTSNQIFMNSEFSFKLYNNSELEDANIADLNNINNNSKIPFYLFHKILDAILLNVNSQNTKIVSLSKSCNDELFKMIDFFSLEMNTMNIKHFEEVLKNYFDSKKESIDLILNWIKKLFKKFHDEMFTNVDIFIDNFTNILSESNENIFNSILDILCEISRYKEDHTELILSKLLDKLSLNKSLLNSKGLVILKKLCSVLPVTTVFLKFADAIIKMKDFEFITNILNILDIFLVTHKETEQVRIKLRNKNEYQGDEFFEKIFKAWSFNPISTLSLCIISENFALSYYLILKLYLIFNISGELKMEQDYFIQLAQLVQLIESSIFNNVRVLLLEPVKNIYLVKTLFGILMLLPQGKAYQALSKRMKSIEILLQIDNDIYKQNKPEEINQEEIDYFIKIFYNTQIMIKSHQKIVTSYMN